MKDQAPPPPNDTSAAEQRVRLNRFLARAGFGSRRAVDEIIRAGRVTIDGNTAELGALVEVGVQEVRVDDRLVDLPDVGRVTILLNKPRGVMCTSDDPEGRPTVYDVLNERARRPGRAVAPKLPRVFSVGRLDFQSEGALLLTNDGELAQRLTHPSHHVPKVYSVKLQGELTQNDIDALAEGVLLDGKPTRPMTVVRDRITGSGQNTWYEVVLTEGRNRQIRRAMEALGHRVMRLRRNSIGPIALGDIPIGAWRFVVDDELDALHAAAGLGRAPRNRPGSKRSAPFPDAGSRSGGGGREQGPDRRPADRRGPPPRRAAPARGAERPAPDSRPTGRSQDRTAPGPAPAGGRPSSGRPSSDRPSSGRPSSGRPSSGRPSSGRPSSGRPSSGRPSSDRPSSGRQGDNARERGRGPGSGPGRPSGKPQGPRGPRK